MRIGPIVGFVVGALAVPAVGMANGMLQTVCNAILFLPRLIASSLGAESPILLALISGILYAVLGLVIGVIFRRKSPVNPKQTDKSRTGPPES